MSMFFNKYRGHCFDKEDCTCFEPTPKSPEMKAEYEAALARAAMKPPKPKKDKVINIKLKESEVKALLSCIERTYKQMNVQAIYEKIKEKLPKE